MNDMNINKLYNQQPSPSLNNQYENDDSIMN